MVLRYLSPIGISLLMAFPLSATGQEADRILIGGKEFSLLVNPLEDYYTGGREKERPSFPSLSTANWRGYVATWEIQNGRLYLTKISAKKLVRPPTREEIELEYNRRKGLPGWTPYDPKKQYSLIRLVLQGDQSRWAPYELADLFPGKVDQGRVLAYWFTGELRIPEGNILRYVHMGYGSLYEQERFIQVTAGILMSERVLDNRGRSLPGETELMRQELENMERETKEKPSGPANQKLLPDSPKTP
jgi:hypothetical protein